MTTDFVFRRIAIVALRVLGTAVAGCNAGAPSLRDQDRGLSGGVPKPLPRMP